MITVREKMVHLMDLLLQEVEQIVRKKDPTPQEIAALPALADSIVNITGYAVIEPKDKAFYIKSYGKTEGMMDCNLEDEGNLQGVEIRIPDGRAIAKDFLEATDDTPEAAQN